MMHLIKISGLLIVALGLPALAWAGLTWETREIKRTASPGEKEVAAEFSFKNTGAATVTIRDIQTGCECTVAELPKRTYAPGESGVIKTVFTLGDRMGPQERVITVVTDDPTAPAPTLTLRVEIPELLTYSARMLHWKVGTATTEKFVEVSAAGGNRISNLEVKEIKPDKAQVRIEALQTGEKYRLHIRPIALDASSTIAVTFQAIFADGVVRSFAVYALVR
jgi:hypothetical protein